MYHDCNKTRSYVRNMQLSKREKVLVFFIIHVLASVHKKVDSSQYLSDRTDFTFLLNLILLVVSGRNPLFVH